MDRKMISVDEEAYRSLVKAKGKLEMNSGQDITLGEALAAVALGFVLGLAAEKVLEDLLKEE